MKIPQINEITQYKNPDIEIFEINDFISALILKNDIQPIAQLTIAFSCGSVNEPIPGLANFTLQMLLQGTQNLSAERISEIAENKGIKFSSRAQWDESYITAVFLSEYCETALQLIADCLLNPKFSIEELEGMKIKTLSNLEIRLAEPEYSAHLGFSYNYYQGHNYGHPHLGTRQSISSITVEDCKNMYKELLRSKIFVIAAGNIKRRQIEEFGEKYLRMENADEKNIIEKYEGTRNSTIYLVEKEGAPQSYISMGLRAVDKKAEEYPQFQLLNTIFGGYFGARLNKIIREEKGYTYGVHSFTDSRKYSSVLRISLATSPEYLGDIIKTIENEINRLKTELISEDEILTAKNYIAGSFLRNSETVFQSASLIISTLINDLPIDFYENYIQKIAVTKSEDLMRTANKIFDDYQYTTAISGDIAAMTKSLKLYNNTKIYKLPEL